MREYANSNGECKKCGRWCQYSKEVNKVDPSCKIFAAIDYPKIIQEVCTYRHICRNIHLPCLILLKPRRTARFLQWQVLIEINLVISTYV